ncbi:hypothetical protein [Streptomyces sp. NPDC088141]|uniref:hypothetical protein n=1 Tax=unclassified Streptomyces TaxID=2593676 RepID=UPI003449B802
MGLDIGAAWCGTDLGDHRPCHGIYERYPCNTLPALDNSQFTGAFQWLGDLGEVVPGQLARLQELDEKLAAKGLALPQDVVSFFLSSNLHDALDEVSVTNCRSYLSEPLPSPVEPGAYLICFLSDLLDSIFWYLYLRPSGHLFVVHSHLDYEYEYGAESDIFEEPQSDLDDVAAQRTAIFWCAPSFEHFAYRFWLENRLWRAIHDSDAQPLDAAMQEYLDHYKPLSHSGA